MNIDLTGKTALVTGASRGIGEAIARRFHEAGANVVITSRKEDSLKEVVKSLGERAVYAVAHAGKKEDAERAVQTALDSFGSLDILVNNAATNPYFGPLMDLDEPRAQKTIEVNLMGPLLYTQACWHAYMRDNGGCVINIASVGGLSVEIGLGFYNITKAALIHMTRQLAGELGPKVRVNAIAPGLVRTYFARVLWENVEDRIAKRLPLKRIGEPDDIARVALFLASDMAQWMTGEVVVADGGAMVTPSGGVT